MADINIQMKQRSGSIWDNLYPKTKAENVIETTSKRFVSNSEMDGKQNALGYTSESTANKGIANGYAELDATGKVPSSQLPSYVDDVLEYTTQANFPEPEKQARFISPKIQIKPLDGVGRPMWR